MKAWAEQVDGAILISHGGGHREVVDVIVTEKGTTLVTDDGRHLDIPYDERVEIM